MSQLNLEVVRRIYEGWAARDPEMMSLLDPLIEVYPDPRSAWPGIEPVYHGHEGITRYLASIYDAFADYRAEPERVLDAAECVLVLAVERARGKQSGTPVQINHTAHIWTVREGLATRLDVNWDREDALKAVGLEK
jgi:ketosteroid isomerase-like protein